MNRGTGSILSNIPLDIEDDISMNSLTMLLVSVSNLSGAPCVTFSSSSQDNGTPIEVSVKECFPKCYGEFMDGFIGQTYAVTDTLMVRLSCNLDK
jgi:hypothetical protein